MPDHPTHDPQADSLSLDLDLDAAAPPEDPDTPTSPAATGRFANATMAPPDASQGTAYQGYGGGETGYEGLGSDDSIHFLYYVRVLSKRRWSAITAFLVVFVSVVVYTFTATPLYDANVQILIENENPNVVSFQEVLEQNKATIDYYETQYRILRSRLLARRTLEAEKLWKHRLFVGTSSGVSLDPIAWIDQIGSFVGGLFDAGAAKPREAPAMAETAAQSRAIDLFLGHLTISPVRNSRFVELTYRSPDPELSARIGNAMAKQYIEQNLEFKYLATKEATDFLTQRMADQRKSLEASEAALQQYRERTDSVSLEDKQNIVVERLTALNAAVTKARTDRLQKEAAWNQIRSIENNRAALDTHPLIINNTFIQQLKSQLADLQRQQAQLSDTLGDRHPNMAKVRSAIQSTDAKLQAETGKVVQSIRNEHEVALAQEQGLTTALNQQKSEAMALNRQAIQYGVLRRDTTSNQQMFDGLLQRAKETGIEGELKTGNIRIVDEAEVPRGPSSPNKRINFLVALFGGSLFGIGLAFFFEHLDDRIKQPDEIKSQLGLPYLGMVPLLASKDITGPPLLGHGATQAFSEAFRSIRTNVLFSSAEAGAKSIVVTSTGLAEGKSVVSANIAMSLALAGQRVLLIDADMRRPRTHVLLGAPLEPGLSNVLVGDAKASETVKRTTTPNLWLMTAGKHPPDPAELLGSQRFKIFLSLLGKHFEWVIIDTPPVMAVTDSSVIANGATGVVFVVGAEMTSKGAAKAALEQLDSAKAKYVGGILNKVDLRRNAYYYSHYYRRKYNEYYVDSALA